MALDPSLQLSALTNAQCAALRDEILAVAGMPAALKIRGLMRRIKLGRDVLAIRDAQAREQEAYGVMQANEESAAAALTAQQVPQRALADQARVEQEALAGVDYGTD